jgi:hypothetical protein
MRLRWDSGFNFKNPDRAEYFLARERVNQLEPAGPCTRHGFGKGLDCIPSRLDYQDLSLYTEGASGGFGAFVEIPYREIEPVTSAISPNVCCTRSNFADLTVGTKSLLMDNQLMQLTFQFKTFIPTGDFTKGLGTNHVSLEPALLFTVRWTAETYIQGQLAYWIPIAGDDLYQGNIFHLHFSLNHVLWRPLSNVYVVGTAEFNEWSVLGGNYTKTDFLVVPPPSSGGFPSLTQMRGGNAGPVPVSATTGMFSLGPGVRLFFCDNVDLGVGSAFSVTGDHWAEELIRVEFRWRF